MIKVFLFPEACKVDVHGYGVFDCDREFTYGDGPNGYGSHEHYQCTLKGGYKQPWCYYWRQNSLGIWEHTWGYCKDGCKLTCFFHCTSRMYLTYF